MYTCGPSKLFPCPPLTPSMLYVFPEPVWPKANIHTLLPSNNPSTRGSPICLNTVDCWTAGPKISLNTKFGCLSILIQPFSASILTEPSSSNLPSLSITGRSRTATWNENENYCVSRESKYMRGREHNVQCIVSLLYNTFVFSLHLRSLWLCKGMSQLIDN